MKKTYMKPVTETFDISTEQQLLEGSITEVTSFTTEGLGTNADPLLDHLLGSSDGSPMINPLSNAW